MSKQGWVYPHGSSMSPLIESCTFSISDTPVHSVVKHENDGWIEGYGDVETVKKEWERNRDYREIWEKLKVTPQDEEKFKELHGPPK